MSPAGEVSRGVAVGFFPTPPPRGGGGGGGGAIRARRRGRMLTAIEALAIVAPASIGGRVVVFRGARSFQARIAPRRGGAMDQTPTKVDRRAFLRAAAGATASLPVLTRRASAQPKP